MAKISELQMTDATSWKGLTTENHLGAIWALSPQKANDIVTKIQQNYFGNDIDSILNKFPVKEFEDDRDYYWELESQLIDNLPVVEVRVDGTAVTAASQAGIGFSEFDMVFPKDWFSNRELIVGEQNELYPIRIKSNGRSEGVNTVYTCELMTGTATDFIPFEEISGGQLFSREFAPVERTMSEGGRQIKHKSHITMRNAFSQIRIEKATPGNLSGKKMGTFILDDKGNKHRMWQQYESFMFDMEFRQDISRLLMFGTSNRTENGDYMQKGESGYSIVQGSGLREQCEASNTTLYTTFDINSLSKRLLDLSEGKLGYDERNFVASTGERGAFQFHQALEDHSQLFTPSRETMRIGAASADYANKGMSYGGQFVEYIGPNMTKFNLSVDSIYDNRHRNKVAHPDGGVTESYRYDIYDIGTTNGEANIRKVKPAGMDIIHKYIPGLRNPFSPDGEIAPMGTAKDAWEEHKFYCGGVMVTDPTKTAHFIYNG
jgi:hypothetical protein